MCFLTFFAQQSYLEAQVLLLLQPSNRGQSVKTKAQLLNCCCRKLTSGSDLFETWFLMPAGYITTVFFLLSPFLRGLASVKVKLILLNIPERVPAIHSVKSDITSWLIVWLCFDCSPCFQSCAFCKHREGTWTWTWSMINKYVNCLIPWDGWIQKYLKIMQNKSCMTVILKEK